jgi:methyl-accepting chemotaxis protein
MNDVVASVRRVTDIMGEITSASSEQSIGIDQVNTAITQMDQVTQQNAALVEQAAAAAASMQEQAARLSDVAASFKLGNEATARPAMAAPPKRAALAPVRPAAARPAPAPRLAAKPAPARASASKPATVGGDKDWEEF